MVTLLPLRVLILEDQPADAELMLDALRLSGFDPDWQRVQTEAQFLAGLNPPPDVILAEYRLSHFDGLTALSLIQKRGLDIPFILVSGNIGEELAVAAVKQGVTDYVNKDRLIRLGQAVSRALEDARLRDEQRRAVEELRKLKEFNEYIVQTMTESVAILDPDGIITFVNSAAAALTGYTPSEALGLGLNEFMQFVPAEQHAIIVEAAEQHRQGKANWLELEVVSPKGVRRNVIVRSTPRFEEGRFTGALYVITDITEQKVIENELRKLHTAVEQSSNSVVITDVQGNIEYVNRKFTEVTGYTSEEVIGKNPRILKGGETSAQEYRQLWETITAGKEWTGEFHNRKKNGELYWGAASISPIKDGSGKITGFLAVTDDATARKRAEDEIRSLAKFPGENPQPVVRLGRDGIVLYANARGQALLEEMGVAVGGNSSSALADLAAGVLDDRADRTIELQLGDTIWSLFAVPIVDGGYVNIYGADITSRKRAENLLAAERNLLQTLIDNVPNRIYAKDTEGRFTLKNLTDLRQIGAASTHEIIGKTDFDYYPLELASQYYADDQTVIKSGQPLIEHEEPFVDSKGNRGWLLTTKVPLRDDHGEVIGLVGIGRDITARKSVDEKLRKVNRTLAVLSDVNQAIVRVRSTPELFDDVCRIAVERGGFRMAWIGVVDPVSKHVTPVAHAGAVDSYFERLFAVLNDETHVPGPTTTAVKNGKCVVVNDIENDPSTARWRDDALALGFRAMAVFPLEGVNEVVGSFALYADVPEFFDNEELSLLEEMTGDIAFAMKFSEQESQRQQAEAALKHHVQALEELRLTLETTLNAFPANTAVLAPDGTVVNVNDSWRAFAEENGAPSGTQFVGWNYLKVCDEAAGKRAEEATPAAAGIRAVINGLQDAFDLEYPCHSPLEKRWFALRVTPFPEPAPRRVVVAQINITERKHAEEVLLNAHTQLEQRVLERTVELQTAKERVEAILNYSTNAILLVHMDHGIQAANSAFNRMFGYEQDDYLGKSLVSLLSPNERHLLITSLQNALKHKRVNVDVEAQRADGVLFDAELSIGVVNYNSFICTFHDISERKKLEQTLRNAIAKEKELNELKSRFVSMASHEFRTPLAAIYATTETLSAYRHKLTAQGIDEKLANIRMQVGYLRDTMDDVLKLAQLQARRFEFNPEPTDLDVLCREVVAEFQSRNDITHALRYTCERAVPLTNLDRKLMRQLISNILSNAIKYSLADEAILMKLECTGEMLSLSVQDGGIGIPEADLPHLFEPFHRGANVGTIHGTGLGLVISKEAADLHGASITVESQLGVATTFTIHIPIAAQVN